jgi:hypothetical protein
MTLRTAIRSATPLWWISSAISSAMEAVEQKTVDWKSSMNCSCMSTFPGPTGTARAPSFSQPS